MKRSNGASSATTRYAACAWRRAHVKDPAAVAPLAVQKIVAGGALTPPVASQRVAELLGR